MAQYLKRVNRVYKWDEAAQAMVRASCPLAEQRFSLRRHSQLPAGGGFLIEETTCVCSCADLAASAELPAGGIL